jgi:cell division protein FtsN
VRTERRHSPRMTVKGLAYVNLAPDNGGTILNVSEGGLCFQSRAPVYTVDAIRFWFSYRSQRVKAAIGQADELRTGGVSRFIEVCCGLAWIDDTRKRGGLRFKNLPETAREQIRDWMHEPALVHVNEPLIPKPSRATRSFGKLARISTGLQELVRQIQTARQRTGFSGGLLSGILLSAALVGLFSLLIHSHRLGDSIVQLGELLGGRPSSQPLVATLPPDAKASLTSPKPPEPATPERGVGLAESQEPQALAAPVHVSSPEKSPSTASPAIAKSGEVRPEAASRTIVSVSRALARPVVPRMGVSPTPELEVSMPLAPTPKTGLANPLAFPLEASKAEGAVMGAEKYLEVGNFKEKLLADKQIDRLSQLDFPANVNQRNRFFGKSYQVLVGPYETDSEAEVVHKELSSRGFNPRSYERGKRNFTLRPGLRVGSRSLPVGDCVITWESYMPDAIVKIETPHGQRVTLEGKWEQQSGKYPQDAIAYIKDRDGSLALVEIRFSGLRQTLVFPRGN